MGDHRDSEGEYYSDADWLVLAIDRLTDAITDMKEGLMATLEQVVADDTDVATQVKALIDAFDAAIAARPAGTLTADQQAQVDAADATLQATKASIVAALAAAQPPAPAPAPAPAPTPPTA